MGLGMPDDAGDLSDEYSDDDDPGTCSPSLLLLRQNAL